MSGDATDRVDLELLVRELTDARASALRIGGGLSVQGVRAVSFDGADRCYLVAFGGGRFLCLDSELGAVRSHRVVIAISTAVLLVERAEDEVDVAELHRLAGAFTALRTDSDAMRQALGDVSGVVREATEAAYRLAAWRAAPERALASLPQLEQATHLHDRLRVAHGEFLRLTEPLVERQEGLDASLVDALREIDAASGAANVGSPLAGRLADWVPDCDEGAADVVRAHLTPVEADA